MNEQIRTPETQIASNLLELEKLLEVKLGNWYALIRPGLRGLAGVQPPTGSPMSFDERVYKDGLEKSLFSAPITQEIVDNINKMWEKNVSVFIQGGASELESIKNRRLSFSDSHAEIIELNEHPSQK